MVDFLSVYCRVWVFKSILVLILPACSFWHVSMCCIPSWPARTTPLRWSAELLKSTTWRISAVRNSASARHSNVEKVGWAQTIYAQFIDLNNRKKFQKISNLFSIYCLSILLCSPELQIPDKANVFYAMCTSSNYDFVLRQRWRSNRRCFGSSSSPVDAAKTRCAKWKMPVHAEYTGQQRAAHLPQQHKRLNGARPRREEAGLPRLKTDLAKRTELQRRRNPNW